MGEEKAGAQPAAIETQKTTEIPYPVSWASGKQTGQVVFAYSGNQLQSISVLDDKGSSLHELAASGRPAKVENRRSEEKLTRIPVTWGEGQQRGSLMVSSTRKGVLRKVILVDERGGELGEYDRTGEGYISCELWVTPKGTPDHHRHALDDDALWREGQGNSWWD